MAKIMVVAVPMVVTKSLSQSGTVPTEKWELKTTRKVHMNDAVILGSGEPDSRPSFFF